VSRPPAPSTDAAGAPSAGLRAGASVGKLGRSARCGPLGGVRLPIVALAVLALACGDVVARAKPSPDGSAHGASSGRGAQGAAPPPVEILPARREGAPVGAIERPEALRRFFEALDSLEDKSATRDVRIVQLGDSHTAADIDAGTIRRMFQARFGDGGRGFVAIGKPFAGWAQDQVRVGMSGFGTLSTFGARTPWQVEHPPRTRGRRASRGRASAREGDGIYGLSGFAIESASRTATAWTEVRTEATRAEVAFLARPRGGSFEVRVDGVRFGRVSTAKAQGAPSSAYAVVPMPSGAPHRIEVAPVGDGPVRLFGVSFERDAHGVVLDTLGINGARVTTPLAWDEAHFTEQLRHVEPQLVVLAYGTNESGDDTTPQAYERQIVDLLGRIARASPAASCLLLGPPDRALDTPAGWETSPKLLEVIATQRRVAAAAGCAYYDRQRAMGGDGSIAAWAMEDPPRARKDRVHLTRDGYVQLGAMVAADLLRAHQVHRAARSLGPPRATIPPAPPPSAMPSVDPSDEELHGAEP
jgi:lysophospholipase L1-like esterase